MTLSSRVGTTKPKCFTNSSNDRRATLGSVSKKERQEFTRTISGGDYIDIRVKSTSPDFDAAASEALRKVMAEQLSFEAVKEYLDLSKATPPPLNTNLNEPRGASTMASVLVRISSPWTFWSGVVLKSLDSMFGSSTSTSINNINMNETIEINWNQRFSLLHNGSLTVGDLKDTQIVKESR